MRKSRFIESTRPENAITEFNTIFVQFVQLSQVTLNNRALRATLLARFAARRVNPLHNRAMPLARTFAKRKLPRQHPFERFLHLSFVARELSRSGRKTKLTFVHRPRPRFRRQNLSINRPLFSPFRSNAPPFRALFLSIVSVPILRPGFLVLVVPVVSTVPYFSPRTPPFSSSFIFFSFFRFCFSPFSWLICYSASLCCCSRAFSARVPPAPPLCRSRVRSFPLLPSYLLPPFYPFFQSAFLLVRRQAYP